MPIITSENFFKNQVHRDQEEAIGNIYAIADEFNAQEDRDNYIDILWDDEDRAIFVNDIKITLKEI